MPDSFEGISELLPEGTKKVPPREERKARLNLSSDLDREVFDFIWDSVTDSPEPPPGVEEKDFLRKKFWDLWVEPIFEYQTLVQEIDDLSPNNTKRKVSLRELEEQRREVEARFERLPGWKDQHTDAERIKYLRRVAKTIGLSSF